jgi:hypothetical protein
MGARVDYGKLAQRVRQGWSDFLGWVILDDDDDYDAGWKNYDGHCYDVR